MNEAQREQAHALLRAALSQTGYDKALAIMDLETVLQRLEPGERYDRLNYAFAVFGEPQRLRPWGWSVEGHHLSLHFTVIGDRRITVTPFFMGAAPAVVAAATTMVRLYSPTNRTSRARSCVRSMRQSATRR